MRYINRKLTATRINSAKSKERPYKLTDGGGLVLAVLPGARPSRRRQHCCQTVCGTDFARLGGTRSGCRMSLSTARNLLLIVHGRSGQESTKLHGFFRR